jgi:hypothetical protein
MVTVPIPRSDSSPQRALPHPEAPATGVAGVPPASAAGQPKSPDLTHFLAAGTLVAGGILMITGRRRAGMAVAAAGTAFALLEEQEAVKQWWKSLPGFLSDAQHFLDRLEGYLHEASVQGQRLQGMLRSNRE